jgi:AcrR family transcriptional regulator
MDIFVVVALLALGVHVFKTREQKERIALLGSYLGKFQIEKLMQDVLDGYQRALGESDTDRQAQVWRYLEPQERTLVAQFARFVLDFAEVYEARARVSRLPLALPFVSLAFPGSTFDLRKLMSVHEQGISRAVANGNGQDPKRKAYTLMAELLLMQHSCHWFCRSKIVASARMMARHKTAYAQLLASVSTETRQAYAAVVGQ